jgi:DHA1 family bicyclomycin/chloramphenicol resistance-like MFS transporter
MVGSFSVDTYLPAFPDIERSLNTSSIAVQQTLAVYMLAFAGMSLWHGALSDSFGRRNVILVTLTIFVIASLGCAATHSIEYLWAFRILQGLSAGAGAIVGRAMIRDLYEGPEAQKLFSMVTMVFAIAPAIAPIMGGWIVSLLNWRSIFLFLFGFSALVLLYCWRKLPETLPPSERAPFNASSLWQNYRNVLGTLCFHLYAGTISLYHAGFFLYIASAPAFIIEHLHLSPHDFGWLFLPAIAGIFTGSMLTNRLAHRVKPTRQIRYGFMFMLVAAVGNFGYHELFPAALPWSVLPLFFYGVGLSMTSPALTLMVLDLFPDVRGIAASCQTFLQLILSAAVAGVISPLLGSSPVWLAAGQFGFVAAAIVLWILARTLVRHEARNSV